MIGLVIGRLERFDTQHLGVGLSGGRMNGARECLSLQMAVQFVNPVKKPR